MAKQVRHLFLAALLVTCGHCPAQSVVDTQEAFVAKSAVPIKRGSLVVLLPPPPASARVVVQGNAPRSAQMGAPADPQAGAQAVARGEQLVLLELARQLKAAGLRVSVLDAASFEALLAAADEARGSASPQGRGAAAELRLRALPALAEEVCAQVACAAVIEPRIVSRRMTVADRHAEWDGVARRLPFSSTGGGLAVFRGSVPGLSVALLGLAANGKVMFRTYGGAAIPFETDAVSKTTTLRVDLFSDAAEIAEGVAVALRPLVDAVVR